MFQFALILVSSDLDCPQCWEGWVLFCQCSGGYVSCDCRTLVWALLVPVLLSLAGLSQVPETPHWLAQRNRLEEALVSLALVRNNQQTQEEVMEITGKCQAGFATPCRELFRGVASPVILCHKGPARVSKVPYEERSFRTQKDGSFCLLLSCSLWHKITGKTMNQWPMRTNPRWTSTNESGEHWCEERREQSGSRMEKIKTKLGILTSRSFLGAFLIAEPLNILLSCSGLSMLMFYSGTKTGANHTIIPWCNHTIIPWWYYFWWYYWIRIISESESESYNHSIQSLHDDIISVEDWLI